MRIIRNLIKKWIKFYDRQDIENALANTPSAKDREDFEWKLKQMLFK